VRLDTLAPASAPAAPQPGTVRAGPFPTSPKRPLERPEPVDPCQIPLPPSPQLSPIHDDETSDGEEVDTVSEMGSSSTSVSRDDTTLKRTKPSGMLSLQGFDFDEEDEEEELAEREASENGDMVRDLRPIRIPSNSGRSGLGSAYPDTPASANSAIEEIVTPTSSEGSPPRGFSTKLAGSSPPRKAPIGTSLGADLGRKESKWRKSIMGLSDVSVTSGRWAESDKPDHGEQEDLVEANVNERATDLLRRVPRAPEEDGEQPPELRAYAAQPSERGSGSARDP
jgi:hypothetical protein